MRNSDVPPYLQIAEELRRRITSGELAPGTRLPSTREITRQWGVAMATATKVINVLRQEALVVVTPGVGTVIATDLDVYRLRPTDRTGSLVRRADHQRASTENGLTIKRIVAAGIAVVDAEGLSGLSMRRVAVEVGAATMSLYRHVNDKEDLLTKMISTAVDESNFSTHEAISSRQTLEQAARTLWTTFRNHPWLAAALSLTRPQPIAGGLPFTELVLTTLEELGLQAPAALTAYITLFNYVRGTAVNLEIEREAEAASGLDREQWMVTQQADLESLLASGQFPVSRRLLDQKYDFDLDALFEYGLGRLLDGIFKVADERRHHSY